MPCPLSLNLIAIWPPCCAVPIERSPDAIILADRTSSFTGFVIALVRWTETPSARKRASTKVHQHVFHRGLQIASHAEAVRRHLRRFRENEQLLPYSRIGPRHPVEHRMLRAPDVGLPAEDRVNRGVVTARKIRFPEIGTDINHPLFPEKSDGKHISRGRRPIYEYKPLALHIPHVPDAAVLPDENIAPIGGGTVKIHRSRQELYSKLPECECAGKTSEKRAILSDLNRSMMATG